jgi:nitrate reductase gamma subunit
VVSLFRTGFHGLKFLACSEGRVYLKVLSNLSKDEFFLQIFESKLFLRGNRAKLLFYTVFFNKFHHIANLIAFLYFKEKRLLKIWSPKDKYIQIPIQNGKMKVVFYKFHHRTNGTFV